MRLHLLRPLLLTALVAGCNSVLDVDPINDIPEEAAITSPATARAALAGLYDALQDDSYYGGELFFFGDLSGDDVQHTGTFTTYRQIDQNGITSDNGSIESFWDALYIAVGRANIILDRVPGVPGIDPAERDDILGQARLLRALTYHNLVKFWGEPAGMGVPLVLTPPPPDIASASQVTRATTAEVYTQILTDLQQAESLLVAAGEDPSSQGVIGIVRSVRARVFLYQGNYAAAETEAESVGAMGYALAPTYAELFAADATDEDIFRLAFDPVDFNWLGYYYRHTEEGGRREITPSDSLAKAYDPAYDAVDPATYNPVDARGQHNIVFYDSTDATSLYGSKWATGIGDDHLHVIRFAEILLIQAEAEARQSKLGEAEATLTPLRVRAGLAAAGLDTMTQAAAIAAILQERRLELAYEGDRWPDLVRTGLAVATLGIPAFQTLYPIPLNERDVTTPPLPQNPGY